jgi:hypothetical protein
MSLKNPAQILEILSHLQQRVFAAKKIADLEVIAVNETNTLSHYRQAVFLRLNSDDNYKVSTASGLVEVAEDSPYVVWLNRFAKQLSTKPGVYRYDHAASDENYREGWSEWLPENIVFFPLVDANGVTIAGVLYGRDDSWSDEELTHMYRLHQNYAYCYHALKQKRSSLANRISKNKNKPWAKWVLGAVLLLLLVPVRLSVLAPAEVVALHSVSVAAPQNGVVGEIFIQPNQKVNKGDSLFALDGTTLRNEREIAAKVLDIAKAQQLVARQRAFDDIKSKAELAAAVGRVREKQAELEAVESRLARLVVSADRDAIAVFTDVNDWLGKTVQTGERIMQLANEDDAGVLIWLPVSDALNLESGSPMKMFLHTKPLSPLNGELIETSYQPVKSPTDISSHRLRAVFNDDEVLPRLGLRGTARLSGEWTVLGYYLFRRPIAVLREWTGL